MFKFMFIYLHKVQSLSRNQLFVTPRTVAFQPPPSMGFSRQEYWTGLPFPSPGDLLDPGIKTGFIKGRLFTSEPQGEPHSNYIVH